MSLLSSPNVAIPSNFSTFLLQLLERAVSSLSLETIRPIYQILSAIGSSYLDVLSVDVVSGLQSRLVKVLTKLEVDPDQYGDLLRLAVLAKFASRPCTEPERNADHPSDMQFSSTIALSPPADIFLLARKYFGGKKADQTLSLTVCKAVNACSEKSKLNSVEIQESLQLSTDILDALDSAQKSTWTIKYGGRIKKLYQKMFRQDINSEVQCAVSGYPFPSKYYLLMYTRLSTSLWLCSMDRSFLLKC